MYASTLFASNVRAAYLKGGGKLSLLRYEPQKPARRNPREGLPSA